MRQKLKKTLALVLSLTLVLALLPARLVLANPVVTASGYVGGAGRAPWRLYNNGHLYVGEGQINSVGSASPWADYSGSITQITFEGPVTAGNSLRALFSNLSNVTAIHGLGYFDTGSVTNMNSIFSGLSSVTSLDLSGWDMGRVVSMNSMFYGTTALTGIDVTGWDTSNVSTMTHMFRNAGSLVALDVSGWDTANVTNMSTMFYGAGSLVTLDVSGWDTSRVTTMNRMFSNAESLTAIDVSAWDTSNVTDMVRMFQGASSLAAIDVSGWDTGNVTNIGGMFEGTTSLTSLDVSGWDTSNVTNMTRLFQEATGLTSLDVSAWDTSNVTIMSNVFFGASALTTLDVSGWDTGRVTNMGAMFRDTGALTALDVSSWDTSRVTNMGTMFYNAGGPSALAVLDVSGWDTRSVTNMDRMFLNAGNVAVLDVSGWYTGNVTNMNSMFRGVSGVSVLDVSGWDTRNVTNFANMFRDVTVTTLDVSGWDTGRVTSMLGMFQGAGALTNLDVSGWDTGNVTSMANMFFGASSITALDLSGWDVGRVTSMSTMFRDASSLASLDLSGWDTRRAPATATIMTDMFRSATALRRITLGENFVHEGTTNPNLPARTSNAEFTGLWLNITPPSVMLPIASNILMPPTGGGPYSPGIWVWERIAGVVMISVDGMHRFPTVAVGYPSVTPLSVAVANAGTVPVNVPLTITLGGANPGAFALVYGNMPPGNTIPVRSSWADAFSIAPVDGLPAGTYTATVTVSGEDINTETFTVTFTVLPYTIVNAVITFADAVFDGGPKHPDMTVTLMGEVLTRGIHYEIVPGSWVNNINARNYNDPNPPQVTIRGLGDFEREGSQATGAFTIRRRPVTLTRGSFGITKVYDGTTSSTGATPSGSLALGNLVANHSTRVRAVWTAISDYGAADVDTYEVTMTGISLESMLGDDMHLNYDLGVIMLAEIPASITPATFTPVPSATRTVVTGAVRTVTIPLSELTPVPTAPRTLGTVNSVEVHNYTAGPLSTTAMIIGNDIVITTRADKPHPGTEAITVRFDTLNFGNIDAQVNLTTQEGAASFSITYTVTGTAPETVNNMPTTPQTVESGTPNVNVAPWPTTSETTNGGGVAGTWTFSGWTTASGGVTLAGTAPNQTFTMPGNNVEFTGSWSFSASAPVITIITHPAPSTVVSGAALNVNLNVVASVTQGATLSFQWYSSTSNTNTGGTPIAGETGSSFLVPYNLPLGTHYFYVVVSAVGAQPVASNVAIVIVTEDEFRGIALSPSGSHTFPAAYLGYGIQEAHTVTIANAGTLPTGPLTIALTGAGAGSFVLNMDSVADIDVGGSTNFTVRPATGLAVGTHTATVVVAGEEGMSESFVVSFTVNTPANTPTPTPTITPTPTPTATPTPTPTPTSAPTPTPTPSPTPSPTPTPFDVSTPTPTPTAQPTAQPTATPTTQPTSTPTPTPISTQAPQQGTPSAPRTTNTPSPATPTPTPSPTPELHLAYMFGDTSGNLRPRGYLTRAEAATILARIQLLDFQHNIRNLPPGMAAFDAFADVRPGQWFYYYVAWAYDAGLVQGFAGNFRPNDPITREELAAIIVRTQAAPHPPGNMHFADTWQISGWARQYVYTAHSMGLIIGDPSGNFRPRDNITRAETATAINRLLGRIDSQAAMQAASVENITLARRFPDVRETAWYYPSVVAATNDHYLTRDGTGAVDWMKIVR